MTAKSAGRSLAWFAAITQLTTVCVAALGVYYAYEAMAAAQRQAADADKTLADITRPWIGVTALSIHSIGITEWANGLEMQFTATVQNYGQSAALDVGLESDLHFTQQVNSLEIQQTTCRKLDLRNGDGTAVFPSVSVPIATSVTINRNLVPKPDVGLLAGIWMSICVRYKLGGVEHHTGYTSLIRSKSGSMDLQKTYEENDLFIRNIQDYCVFAD